MWARPPGAGIGSASPMRTDATQSAPARLAPTVSRAELRTPAQPAPAPYARTTLGVVPQNVALQEPWDAALGRYRDLAVDAATFNVDLLERLRPAWQTHVRPRNSIGSRSTTSARVVARPTRAIRTAGWLTGGIR